MVNRALADFLPYALSQKSASLVVASSAANAAEVIEDLEAAGFESLRAPGLLESAGKRFLRLSRGNAKEAYDLARQYGTGQISVFDGEAHRSGWVSPAYVGSALLLVADRDTLFDIEADGLPMRAAAGLAVQTA